MILGSGGTYPYSDYYQWPLLLAICIGFGIWVGLLIWVWRKGKEKLNNEQ